MLPQQEKTNTQKQQGKIIWVVRQHGLRPWGRRQNGRSGGSKGTEIGVQRKSKGMTQKARGDEVGLTLRVLGC